MLPIVYEALLPATPVTLELSAENRHYLARVLRLRAGEEFDLADGRGARARARWQGGMALMLDRTTEPRPYALPLTLLLPLLATGKMRDTVHAAAACGVDRILAWTPARGKITGAAAKPDRWRAVAADAGRVAGSAWLPEISAPLPLPDALAAARGGTLLLLDRAGAHDWRPARPLPAAGYVLILGPESGFNAAELQLCRDAGATPLSLGPATLRIEQAVLAALAIVRFLTA